MCGVFPPQFHLRSVVYCCACAPPDSSSSSRSAPPRAEQSFGDFGAPDFRRSRSGFKHFRIPSRCTNRFCTHTTTALDFPKTNLNRLERISRRILRRPPPTSKLRRPHFDCPGCDRNLFVEALVWVCWACEEKNLVWDEARAQFCWRCSYEWDSTCAMGYSIVPFAEGTMASWWDLENAVCGSGEGWFVDEDWPMKSRSQNVIWHPGKPGMCRCVSVFVLPLSRPGQLTDFTDICQMPDEGSVYWRDSASGGSCAN